MCDKSGCPIVQDMGKIPLEKWTLTFTCLEHKWVLEFFAKSGTTGHLKCYLAIRTRGPWNELSSNGKWVWTFLSHAAKRGQVLILIWPIRETSWIYPLSWGDLIEKWCWDFRLICYVSPPPPPGETYRFCAVRPSVRLSIWSSVTNLVYSIELKLLGQLRWNLVGIPPRHV